MHVFNNSAKLNGALVAKSQKGKLRKLCGERGKRKDKWKRKCFKNEVYLMNDEQNVNE